VKRQYLSCVGKVANGINTVHLAYVRERAGHALIGAREWIPAEYLKHPVKSVVMGLPADLVFRTKGQLAIDILAEAFADGVRLDFVCGDEVYGSCTQLREFLEACGQAYVLRVPSSFRLTLAGGITLTCQQAAARLTRRGWEIRSAGSGSKGQRWYAWAWLTSVSTAGRLSRLSSSLWPGTSHSGTARWPASSASTMSCWCSRQSGTSLPSGARVGRRWWRAKTMRTVVTAVLQQTARQRFGSHSLVSDGPPPVTRLPPGRSGITDHDGTAAGHIGPIWCYRRAGADGSTGGPL
jgi:hypothetical protein